MGLKLAEVARFLLIVKQTISTSSAGRDNAGQEAGKTGAGDWRRRWTRNMAGSICKRSHKTGTWLKYSTTNMPEQTKT